MPTAPPGISLRPAVRGDAAGIARLLTSLGHSAEAGAVEARWTAWAAEGNSGLVAAAADGALAGLATLHRMTVLHRPRPVGRITALVVDPAMRGRGIGRALVEAAEEALAAAGCGLLEITSHRRLVQAHAFYEHLGYAHVSLRLAKDLPPPAG